MWEKLISDNHCGYNETPNYNEILADNPIQDTDLGYFASVIDTGLTGGQGGYDSFPDAGGIDIAAVLLEEVKRLRQVNT